MNTAPAGFQRACALPKALARFGTPSKIVAAGVTLKPTSHDPRLFSYARCLATVEPLAIALGLPVDASEGWDESGQEENTTPLVTIVRDLYSKLGGQPGRSAGLETPRILTPFTCFTSKTELRHFCIEREGLSQ